MKTPTTNAPLNPARLQESTRTKWTLCKLGWKAKRPTGLGVDFRYVRPGANAKGNEGIDVFTGELCTRCTQCSG
ncbi:hypothetical protein DVH05_000033 [Phytophthora capsici]|nr:hypothetical protein DVH05_000033 [Phytophthora capsici]